MAEASLSDFCDSIVDFLTESSTSEFDQLLDEDGSASAAGNTNPRPISPHPSSFEAATPTDLQQFYAEVRKADGNQYKPDSLRTMLAALDRHLRQNGATFSIINDRQFEESRKTFNGRAIILRERGMGKKKDALTPAEERCGPRRSWVETLPLV